MTTPKSADITPTTPAETEEKVTLSKAEYDKLQDLGTKYSESTKEAQKLSWENKLWRDPSKMEDLIKSDKKLANTLAQQWNYASAQEYLDDLKKSKNGKDSDDDEEMNLEKIEEKILAKQEKKDAQKSVDQFLKDKNIKRNSDFFEDFNDIFEDLMDGKKWTVENVEKNTRRAYQESKETSKFFKKHDEVTKDLKTFGGNPGISSRPTFSPQRGTYEGNKSGQKLSDLYKKK